MNAAILDLQSVSTGYGDSIIVKNISLSLQEGEVVCLLGANGAGKTTIMRAITGLIPLAGGKIVYRGEDISHMPAHDRVAAGISLSPEGRQVFPDLTVMENLALGAFNKRARESRQRNLDHVFELFPRLAERKGQAAGLMSGGEQQMLAIARALMGEPKVLALDEPSLGLAPKVVLTVFEAIKAVAQTGITILLVEQNTRAALTVAQRGYAISAGKIVHEGSTGDLMHSEMIQKAFIGEIYHGEKKRVTRRQRRLAAMAGGASNA